MRFCVWKVKGGCSKIYGVKNGLVSQFIQEVVFWMVLIAAIILVCSVV